MAQKVTLEFTIAEVLLIDEALRKAASRHESESRFNPRAAGPHDKQANKMHQMRVRLLTKVKEISPDAV